LWLKLKVKSKSLWRLDTINMSNTTSPSSGFGWQHATVIGFGLLVFVLLMFADKTNLNDDKVDEIGESESSSEAGEGPVTADKETTALLKMVPEAEGVDDISLLLTALDQEKNKENRSGLLRDLVEEYQVHGRLDLAAIYAGALAREIPDAKNQLVAGALFRNANRTQALMSDTVAFREFSDQSIYFLEQIMETDPGNEDAKIELGLAYVEARSPGLSMQGILKIREVAEANPNNTEALFHLGGFSIETGQFDKAEGRFRQILEVDAGNNRAKYFLGVSLREQGKFAEFKKWMTEVAEQQQDTELAAAASAALKNNQ